LGHYVKAFDRLSRARGTSSCGPRPIRLSEIESYCRLFGWCDPEDVGDLVDILQAMDAAFLDGSARLRDADRWTADPPGGSAAGGARQKKYRTPNVRV
jgi:hypothetical protein